MSDLKMHSDVPASLHPGVLDGLPDLAVIGAARGGLERAYARLSRYHDALGEIRRDPTLTEGARELQAEQLREKTEKQAGDELNAVGRSMGAAIQGVEQRLSDATRPDRRTAEPREVRDYVRSLAPDQRLAFLTQRADAGDRETVHAVVESPAYLSGLEDGEAGRVLRDDLRRRLAPDVAAELESLRRAWSRLLDASGAFAARYSQRNPRADALAAKVAARERAVGAALGA